MGFDREGIARNLHARKLNHHQHHQRRKLFFERLEPRLLLAGDWTNPHVPLDVGGDGRVTPLDAAALINQINSTGFGPLSELAQPAALPPFFDVTGDGDLTALDLLTVVNALNMDTAGPSLALELANDAGFSGSDRLTFDPRVAGSAVDQFLGVSRVRGRVDDGPFADVPIGPDGGFMYTPPLPTDGSADGWHAIEIEAFDGLENRTTAGFSFLLDTGKPAVPTTPALLPDSDSGASASDGITSVRSPRMQGNFFGGEAVSVRLQANGRTLDEVPTGGLWQATLAPLTDGVYRVSAVAVDAAGNESPASEPFHLTVDNRPPTILTGLTGTLRQTFDTLPLEFGDSMAAAAFDPGSFSLSVLGGDHHGQSVGIAAVSAEDRDTAVLHLAESLPDQGYRFTIRQPLFDLAGNVYGGPTTFDFTVADPPSVARLSPSADESQVRLSRELVVELDEAVDPASVTADSFYALAGGERLAGSIRVSRDEKTVTLLTAADLPPSTNIRVMLDGNRITGRDGMPLDADGDLMPGGMADFDFTTVAGTSVPDTSVFGYVWDSQRRNADGSSVPIVGARLSVEGRPDLVATTDATGRFQIDNVPFPEFFVEIDGGPATNAPPGSSYGRVCLRLRSVAGQSVPISDEGVPFDLFLPLLAAADAIQVVSGQATMASFHAAAMQQVAEIVPGVDPHDWEMLAIEIPRDSLFLDDGTPAAQVRVVPLDPDRVPLPLPAAADPAIVFRVDAGGAEHLDVPAVVTYPNLDGLPPGEQRFLYSFGHDDAEWRLADTMTVSADGRMLVSNDGVRTLGWHFVGSEPDSLGLGSPPVSAGLDDTRLAAPSGGPARRPRTLPLTNGGAASDEPFSTIQFPHGNNLGGVAIEGERRVDRDFATLVNGRSSSLTIFAIDLIAGSGAFELLNVPADLAAAPITLAPGDSFTFGVAFDPGRAGLDRALIEIATNDPARPWQWISAVGTGLPEIVSPQWGKDYLAVATTVADRPRLERAQSNGFGEFQVTTPANTDFHVVVFDPATGLVAHGFGRTPDAGEAFDLTANLVFDASRAADGDDDGLPDDIEFALGTALDDRDTDRDGIDDFGEWTSGLNPRERRMVPIGIVGNVRLRGTAEEVVLVGSRLAADGQTAYVATGNYGLAVVDTTRFNQPIVLGQLDLPGSMTDVAVDAVRSIAALAAGDAGVHLVEVSDPVMPRLIRTLTDGGAVRRLEWLEGVLYTAGDRLNAIDLATGAPIESLDLHSPLRDLTLDGRMLYAITADNRLHVIDLRGSRGAVRGSVAVPHVANRVFVAGGVAYVSDGREATQVVGPNATAPAGHSTFNVSNPAAPVLISGIDTPLVRSGDFRTVLNGSGLALVAAGSRGLEMHAGADPAVTYQLLNRFDTPGIANSVALSGGLAYVADGAAGLQVINYLPFDAAGQPPTIAISAPGADMLPERAGVQVVESTELSIAASVTDDLQVRSVELLVDGQVVRDDDSFPFDLALIAPRFADSQRLLVQVRATDSGGNATLSAPLWIDVVPDAVPPVVQFITPEDGAIVGDGTRTVTIGFSEPIDTHRLDVAAIQLTPLADPLHPRPPVAVRFRHRDQVAELTYAALPPGDYTLTLAANSLVDRAGNALAGEQLTSSFRVSGGAVAAAEFINAAGGAWDDPSNWAGGRLPGPDDDVILRLSPGATVEHRQGTTHIHSLTSFNDVRLTGGVLDVATFARVAGRFSLAGGTLKNATLPAAACSPACLATVEVAAAANVVLDRVTLQGDLRVRPGANVAFPNGLTLGGRLTLEDANVSVTGDLHNDGRIELSAASRLSIVGNFFQSADATLSSELTLGGQSGRLGATGQMTLGGTLSLVAPSGGWPELAAFRLLEFGGRSGDFSGVIGLPQSLPNSLRFGPRDLTLLTGLSFTDAAAVPYHQDFSGGSLSDEFIARPSPFGALELTGAGSPHSSPLHLRMTGQGNANQVANNELVLLLQSGDQRGLELKFFQQAIGETGETLPASFVGSLPGDGVSISLDGITWRRVVDLAAAPVGSYQSFAVDLDAAIAAAGWSPGNHLAIKFQQTHASNSPTTALRMFDDLSVDEAGMVVEPPPDSAPFVVRQSPAVGGYALPGIQEITLTFSEPIAATSFTTADIRDLRGPAGPITPTAVSVTGNLATIQFPAQTAMGVYRFAVGPDVRDAIGQPLDQDRDTQLGELVDDSFLSSFEISTGNRWLNPAGGSWHSAANWSLGAVPDATQPVFLSGGSYTITVAAPIAFASLDWNDQSDGTRTLSFLENASWNSPLSLNNHSALSIAAGKTLTVNSRLAIAGGTIAGAGTLHVGASGDLRLIEGTIQDVTVTSSIGASGASQEKLLATGGTLSGVTLHAPLTVPADSTLTVTGGLTLAGSILLDPGSKSTFSTLQFSGAQTLSGSGEIILGGSGHFESARIEVPAGSSLTIGAGVTVTAANHAQINADGSLANHGRLQVSGAGKRLTIGGASFVNHGTIAAGGGSLVSINPAIWHNDGPIAVNSSTLNLAGQFTLNDPAVIQPTNATVNLTGTLDNRNDTLLLNRATGSWILSGGTILGGTLNFTDGQSLLVGGNLNNRLDGVTIGGPWSLGDNAVVRIVGGLIVNGSLRMTGGGNSLAFEGTQTLGGSGELFLDPAALGWHFLEMASPGTLTIGPQLTIRGGNGSVGGSWWFNADMSVVNRGLIAADTPAKTVRVAGRNGLVRNEGTLRATGGLLDVDALSVNTGLIEAVASGTADLDGDWQNQGTIRALQSPNTLRLRGRWDNNGTILVVESAAELGGHFTAADLGDFQTTRATVTVTGTFDNTGHTLVADADDVWRLDGGTIVGGAVASGGTAPLSAAGRFGGALAFSGNPVAVRLPGAAVQGLTDATFEFSYKTSRGDFQTILHAKQHDGGSDALRIFLETDTRLRFDGNTWTLPYSVADGQWHHYAFIRDDLNNLARLYLDGALVGESSASFIPIEAHPRGVVLGQFMSGLLAQFDPQRAARGTLDEFRVWSVRRTQAEIQADRDRPLTGGEANLRALWRFDESAGTTLADATANRFAAKLDTRLQVTGHAANLLDGVTIESGLDLTAFAAARTRVKNDLIVNGDVYLQANAALGFDGSQSLGGGGSVQFAASGGDLVMAAGGTLTIGPNLTLLGGAGRLGGTSGAWTGSMNLVNQGTIQADVAGRTLAVQGRNGTVASSGRLAASQSGILRLENLTGDVGEGTATGGGLLEFVGTYRLTGTQTISGSGAFGTPSTLTLFGQWSNAAEIRLSNGVANLDGEFTTAGLGAIDNRGGTVNLRGRLDNRGASLRPTAAGQWRLDDGEITGGSIAAADLNSVSAAGRHGRGLEFTGSLTAVQLPEAAVEGLSDATFEFWYKTARRERQQILLGKNPNGAADVIGISLESDTRLQFENVAWNLPISIADNQWHHFAIARDDTNNLATLFLDGNSLGGQAFGNGVLRVAPRGLTLGQSFVTLLSTPSPSAAAAGVLDELRIWNRVRGAAEIQVGMQQPPLGDEPGLRGAWRFEESFGTTLADLSPNQFHGRLDARLFVTNDVDNRLDGVTIDGALDATLGGTRTRIANGLTVNGTVYVASGGALGFEGSQTLGGGGRVHFGASSGALAMAASGTLTIGPQLTVQGGAGQIGGTSGAWTGDMHVANQGTIAADVVGRTLLVNSRNGTVRNSGRFQATTGGKLEVDFMEGNLSGAMVSSGGLLDVDGTYIIDQDLSIDAASANLRGTWTNYATITVTNSYNTLILDGQWDNRGTIRAINSTVMLGGEFTTADLGAIVVRDARISVTGLWDNRGRDFSLDAGAEWLLNGGKILGGTLSGGTLDSLTAPGRLGRGLRLDSTNTSVNLPAAAFRGLTNATIEFWYQTEKAGRQAILGGSQPANFHEFFLWIENPTRVNFSGLTWNLAAPLNDGGWHHYAFARDAATNQVAFYLDGVNQGWQAQTAIAWNVFDGGVVLGEEQDALGGGFDSNEAAVGAIDELRLWSTVRSAGEISSRRNSPLTGTESGLRGYWRFEETAGATIFDATAAGFHGQLDTRLNAGNNSLSLLDGVTLNTGLDLPLTNSRARIANGLTLNGTAHLVGTSSLGFVGTQTLAGSGDVFFSGTTAGNLEMAAAGTLTIGPQILVHGAAGVVGGLRNWGANMNVVNQGTIDAQATGYSITVSGRNGTVVNDGTLRASRGNLALTNFAANNGTISIAAGRTVAVTGNLPLFATSLIQLEIAGASNYGKLTVTGTATLAGTLRTTFTNNFTPALGSLFPVLTFASSIGAFNTVLTNSLPTHPALPPLQTATNLTLTAVAGPAGATASAADSAAAAEADHFFTSLGQSADSLDPADLTPAAKLGSYLYLD